MSQQYQIVTIGGGAGGLQCAIHAASRGAKCAIVDKMEVGGECLLCGCIPTKALLRSREVYRMAKKASLAGVEIEGAKVNFSRVMERQKKVVEDIVKRVKKGLEAMKIDYYNGAGTILSPEKIRVKLSNSMVGGGKEVLLDAKNIVIATGSSPKRLEIPGANLPGVLTNREIFNLQEQPRTLVVIGCGYVGVEFATIFAGMGTQITMLEKEGFLVGFERTIAEMIRKTLEQEGVTIALGVNITEIQTAEDGRYKVLYEQNGQQKFSEGELIFMAAGRTPFAEGLFDKGIHIAMNGAGIAVNEYLRTSISGVYALGDVLNRLMTAYTASTEGEVIASNCLGRMNRIDYSVIPRCVFSDPPYACVGLNEEEAKNVDGLDFGIGQYAFGTTPMAEIIDEKEGFVRIIYDRGSGKILGGHILGSHSHELIGELSLAVRNGLTVKELASFFHFHPSLAEAIQRAARAGWLMQEIGK